MTIPSEVFTLIGTLLGGVLGLFGSWKIWKAQRDADRTDRLDASLRDAYVKVLRAAQLYTDGVQELGTYPRGRPHVERVEVTGTATMGTSPQFVSVARDNGDYSRALEPIDEAERLKSEATVDIGVEHDDDACLTFLYSNFYMPSWKVYTDAISGSGPIKDWDKTLSKMRDDQKELSQLVRQSRVAALKRKR